MKKLFLIILGFIMICIGIPAFIIGFCYMRIKRSFYDGTDTFHKFSDLISKL